jgi:hypothetical protein
MFLNYIANWGFKILEKNIFAVKKWLEYFLNQIQVQKMALYNWILYLEVRDSGFFCFFFFPILWFRKQFEFSQIFSLFLEFIPKITPK